MIEEVVLSWVLWLGLIKVRIVICFIMHVCMRSDTASAFVHIDTQLGHPPKKKTSGAFFVFGTDHGL